MGAETTALKSWCAACYEEPALCLLLGGELHPGGPATTVGLGRRLGLTPEMDILDVACGPGRSARHLVGAFGCRVTGIDYSVGTIAAARAACPGARFLAGDAERLPLADCGFDAVVVECSLCLVPDKQAAVAEMRRVLKPGGQVGIADVALERSLPPHLDAAVAWVACLAGACPTAGYRRLLVDGGFSEVSIEDASWALADLLCELGRRLFLLDVAASLRKLPPLPVSPAVAREWLIEASRWIADGSARYLFLTGRRAR